MVTKPVKDCFLSVIKKVEKKAWPIKFEPKAPWFPGSDERCVEIPWAISRYQGQKKILEIGLALADPMLIQAQIKLRELTGCKLSGLDIVNVERVLNRFKFLGCDIRDVYDFYQADARNSGFADNSFDLIFLISTLEHFGFDKFEPSEKANTVFQRPKDCPGELPVYEDCREDRKALFEIKRILVFGGSLLLTVPMGPRKICALCDSKGLWALYKEYTVDEWKNLLFESGLEAIEERFFYNSGEKGWVEAKDSQSLMEIKINPSDPVAGVACVELRKR